MLNYEFFSGFTTSLSGIYTGRMYVPHLAGGTDQDGNIISSEILKYTPIFMDINLKVSYDIDFKNELCMKIYAGVKNMFNNYQTDFDAGLYRDAAYIYGPLQPITPYFGLKLSFGE